jgi:hypothetical protein
MATQEIKEWKRRGGKEKLHAINKRRRQFRPTNYYTGFTYGQTRVGWVLLGL